MSGVEDTLGSILW